MSLVKTLLAGAAVCALCTAPALAAREAPKIHLAHTDFSNITKQAAGHFKSDGRVHPAINFTETVSFSADVPKSDLKMPILLWGEAWYNSSDCGVIPNQKAKFPKTTAAASIKSGTSTGTISGCGSTVFTFYGPLYKLTDKKAKKDAFTGNITAKHFSGYNLDLVANTDVTITK
jgi:hypothetical protein